MKVVDANVLPCATNEDAPLHSVANRWLDRSLGETEAVGFAWVVLLAFVRLTTRAGLFPHPLSLGQALDVVEWWLARPAAVVVEPTPAARSSVASPPSPPWRSARTSPTPSTRSPGTCPFTEGPARLRAMAAARHPRQEAQQAGGEEFFARVLEPSPPAVDDGNWFADDPVNEPGDGRPVVSPAGNGDLTWDEWLGDHPDRAAWAAERWLGARRRLGAVPAALAPTRLGLHRLAAYVMSPARRRRNGKIALRWTYGGFGTPFFGEDEQVRLEGTDLVVQRGGAAVAERHEAATLAGAAAAVLGGPPDAEWASRFDVPPPGDPEEPLGLDPAAAAYLGDWYGFAWSVLEELRAEPSSAEASRVQLWPEHFDAAFECLPEATGRRAGFGASPGDAAVPEPYLYVAPWANESVPPSELWNAESFRGAILALGDLVGADDQRGAALAFFRSRKELLGDGTAPA